MQKPGQTTTMVDDGQNPATVSIGGSGQDVVEPAEQDRSVSAFRRFVRHPATLLAIGIVVMFGAAALSAVVGQAIPQAQFDPFSVLVAILTAAIFVGVYALLVRSIERAPLCDFATRGAVRELAQGIAAGALLFAFVVAIAALLGVYRVVGHNPWQTIWPMLGIAITSGFSEEIILRGVMFRYLERMASSWIALALSAALFGALHLANPHASPVAAFAISIEAGILLGAVYMLTRRLWAAIGLHAAWNFTQGWIFGVPISGTDDPGIVAGRLSGPEWLSGGAFGLEASVIAMIVATTAGLLVLRMAIKRGRLVVPSWRRGTTAAPIFVDQPT